MRIYRPFHHLTTTSGTSPATFELPEHYHDIKISFANISIKSPKSISSSDDDVRDCITSEIYGDIIIIQYYEDLTSGSSPEGNIGDVLIHRTG